MRKGAAGAAATGLVLLAGCTGGGVDMPVPEPDAETAELCEGLAERLPETLFGQERTQAQADSPLVAAWGDPVIALRCGVPRPDAYRPDSELMVVDEVAWLPEPQDEPTMYTAMAREAYVELSVPASYGAPAQGLVAISEAISAEIPALPPGEY
ncbi:DUF3515 domain-containing protein [Nocardiopsis baichengensis]|uniref:DUF3515 domain-containing protein n=1 Tax=Nocardiopsis baichengensis TaxID=280240 RepID=UPI00034A1BB6|nr:DUF3515 domain-containing protein [Nocardiopsis baichengensis]